MSASVLQCVHTRYEGGQYYTWAGPTLVAVNPCHPVNHLYTTSQIEHHHHQVEVNHYHWLILTRGRWKVLGKTAFGILGGIMKIEIWISYMQVVWSFFFLSYYYIYWKNAFHLLFFFSWASWFLFKIGVESHTPHVYSVAGVAHHRLQHDIGLLNQAVLVSGESGSGKVSFVVIPPVLILDKFLIVWIVYYTTLPLFT